MSGFRFYLLNKIIKFLRGVKVIAEGVKREEIQMILTRHLCKILQRYRVVNFSAIFFIAGSHTLREPS